MDDERLDRGHFGRVVRRGDTVLRDAGPWTPAVHRLLDHLCESGVRGVPRPLGVTPDGREVLEHVDGVVPGDPLPDWVWQETALDSAALLLRQVHDATAGLRFEGPWRSPVRAPAEVICHNDFATYNLVFEDGRVVGAIDWDFAAPGPRLWDLAYLAYRIVPLSTAEWGDGYDPADRLVRLERLLREYGSEATPAELVVVLGDRLRALASFTERTARQLDAPALREDAALYRRDAAHLSAAAP